MIKEEETEGSYIGQCGMTVAQGGVATFKVLIVHAG